VTSKLQLHMQLLDSHGIGIPNGQRQLLAVARRTPHNVQMYVRIYLQALAMVLCTDSAGILLHQFHNCITAISSYTLERPHPLQPLICVWSSDIIPGLQGILMRRWLLLLWFHTPAVKHSCCKGQTAAVTTQIWRAEDTQAQWLSLLAKSCHYCCECTCWQARGLSTSAPHPTDNCCVD
jgi:hypothetical protein